MEQIAGLFVSLTVIGTVVLLAAVRIQNAREMPAIRQPSVIVPPWLLLALSVPFGALFYWLTPDANFDKHPLIAGVIGGLCGSWLCVFLIVWYRRGWDAARRISWIG